MFISNRENGALRTQYIDNINCNFQITESQTFGSPTFGTDLLYIFKLLYEIARQLGRIARIRII